MEWVSSRPCSMAFKLFCAEASSSLNPARAAADASTQTITFSGVRTTTSVESSRSGKRYPSGWPFMARAVPFAFRSKPFRPKSTPSRSAESSLA